MGNWWDIFTSPIQQAVTNAQQIVSNIISPPVQQPTVVSQGGSSGGAGYTSVIINPATNQPVSAPVQIYSSGGSSYVPTSQNIANNIGSGIMNLPSQVISGIQNLPSIFGIGGRVQAAPMAQMPSSIASQQAAINSPNPQSFGMGGMTLNVAFGDLAQQQVKNINAVIYDPISGGWSGYTTPYGHSISNIVTGGGAGSLQSGKFTIGEGKELTPVLYTQAGGYMGEFAPGVNVAAANMVLANPEVFSHTGAERYGGIVASLLYGEAGKLRAGIDVMGVYPADSGNMAALVSQQGVNQPKTTWTDTPWNIPASIRGVFSVEQFTLQQGAKAEPKAVSEWAWGGDGTAPLPKDIAVQATPLKITGGVLSGETTFGAMALSALSGAFSGAVSYVEGSRKPATSDILSGKSTFAQIALDYAIGTIKEQQPNPIATTPGTTTNSTETKSWITGGNATISQLGNWITGTKPTIESMDARINAMSAGNVSGSTWTGSKEGYDTITQMINERNKLQEGFSANVTKYNTMSAENPIIKNTEITTKTSGSTITSEPMRNPLETAIVSPVQGLIESITGFLSQNKAAAGVVGMTSGSVGYGYGYAGAEAGFGTGVLGELGLTTTLVELAIAAPVVAGLVLGGIGVGVAEYSGRLGLTGPTQDYSVRTAGEQFGKWYYQHEAEPNTRPAPAIQLSDYGFGARVQGTVSELGGGALALVSDFSARANRANKNVQEFGVGSMALAISLMGSGTGIFSGSETTGRAIYSEVIAQRSSYSEKPATANPTIEIPSQRRSIIEITDTGKPIENVIKNERATPTSNEFIDALGVSYPLANPTRNPVVNPNAYDIVNGYPTKNPNENPDKNPFVYPSSFPDITRTEYPDKIITTTQTSTKTQMQNQYDIIRTYDYQQQMPRNPEPPKLKLDIPTLPNFGLPFGGGGGGAGGSPKNKRAGRFTDIYRYGQGIGNFGSVNPIRFGRAPSRAPAKHHKKR